MFGIFKRISDLEKKVKILEEKNEALAEENVKLSNALLKTQDVIALISKGASALAIDVASIINIISPPKNSNDKNQAKIMVWKPTDDEVIN